MNLECLASNTCVRHGVPVELVIASLMIGPSWMSYAFAFRACVLVCNIMKFRFPLASEVRRAVAITVSKIMTHYGSCDVEPLRLWDCGGGGGGGGGSRVCLYFMTTKEHIIFLLNYYYYCFILLYFMIISYQYCIYRLQSIIQ